MIDSPKSHPFFITFCIIYGMIILGALGYCIKLLILTLPIVAAFVDGSLILP